MAESHKKMLENVFCDVLENLAFMFGEIAEEDITRGPGECLRAQMRFTGPITGSLCLAVPREMCPTIAANVLGLEPDDEAAISDAGDALKELLNVICGHVLTSLMGEEPVFDLTVPEVSPLDADEWRALAQLQDTAAFIVEAYPVLLHLEVEE